MVDEKALIEEIEEIQPEGEEIKNLIEELKNQRFTFAKTYAKTIPHEYIIDFYNKPLFNKMKKLIEEKGVDKVFVIFGRPTSRSFRYVYLGGYKYWIDGDVVLNREPYLESLMTGGFEMLKK
jgi:hypothetical protein